MDIEKVFHSLDHNFLISALEKYGFGKTFLSWKNILLRSQEYCVLIGGTTTKYFLLESFLFILVLEILFHLIRSKPEIKGLSIFDHCHFYSVYADDATFFLQDTIFIKHMVDTWIKTKLKKI